MKLKFTVARLDVRHGPKGRRTTLTLLDAEGRVVKSYHGPKVNYLIVRRRIRERLIRSDFAA
jgi:hypothetical protein